MKRRQESRPRIPRWVVEAPACGPAAIAAAWKSRRELHLFDFINGELADRIEPELRS